MISMKIWNCFLTFGAGVQSNEDSTKNLTGSSMIDKTFTKHNVIKFGNCLPSG